MHTRTSYLSLIVAALLSAGCASQVTAPVRDGVGGVSTGTTTPAPASGFHTVRQGETLLGIARQYGVTLPDLVAWNNVTDPNQIHVGQTIRVAPSGRAPVAIAAPGGAVATPVPPTGTEAGAVPLVREPIGGRAPVAEPAVPEDIQIAADLLETLVAYLDNSGSVEATARTLFVHPNTVRYRLRRIAEVSGYHPADARSAYVLRLAVTLGRLMTS